LIPRTALPWESIPLDDLPLGSIAPGRAISYNLSFDTYRGRPSATIDVDLTLPAGYSYVAGSALVTGEPKGIAPDYTSIPNAPTINGRVVHLNARTESAQCARRYDFTFKLTPGASGGIGTPVATIGPVIGGGTSTSVPIDAEQAASTQFTNTVGDNATEPAN